MSILKVLYIFIRYSWLQIQDVSFWILISNLFKSMWNDYLFRLFYSLLFCLKKFKLKGMCKSIYFFHEILNTLLALIKWQKIVRTAFMTFYCILSFMGSLGKFSRRFFMTMNSKLWRNCDNSRADFEMFWPILTILFRKLCFLRNVTYCKPKLN